MAKRPNPQPPSPLPNPVLRVVRLVAWIGVLIIAFVAGGFWMSQWLSADLKPGTTPPSALGSIGGAFALTDMTGKRVTEADLKGRPTAMFFGFTYCPDVCPTTLTEASAWLKELGPDAARLRIVFVSVDPERDTAGVLKDYLSAFDSRIEGWTGSLDEVETIKKAYRVFARKVPQGSTYTVDHTATVYLLDTAGQFTGTIAYQEPQPTALAKLRRLIGS